MPRKTDAPLEHSQSLNLAYQTSLGTAVRGKSEEVLSSIWAKPLLGSVDLIFTSPPFPLNRKKKYGNHKGEDYLDWLAGFAPTFRNLLTPKGSIVIEVGNAWESGKPIMSTLALRSLLAFMDRGNFVLCQQFIWHNPARLPSPAQWVNVERIRVKDAYTHLWWLSKTERPAANNRRILTEYSAAMKRLLTKQTYNTGTRPSEHNIGKSSFLANNHGAIPSNVITLANTQANTQYLKYCKTQGYQPHPARMPVALAEFFVKFLTQPGDLVLDPFAGSNTTGAAAEGLNRRWISVEANSDYILGSLGRFTSPKIFTNPTTKVPNK